jgi:hypothetical protein
MRLPRAPYCRGRFLLGLVWAFLAMEFSSLSTEWTDIAAMVEECAVDVKPLALECVLLAEKAGHLNGKPKNHRGLCLAAYHCTHPDIDAHDRLLLTYIAQNTDRTDMTAHPGNKNLASAIGLKDRATDDRLTNNMARKLIERTERADGRGKASAYRICWESPFYPDRTPTGEWLVADKEPRTLACADSDVNRAPADPKPRISDGEPRISAPITAHPRVPAVLSSSESIKPSPTTARDENLTYAQLSKYLQTEMLASQSSLPAQGIAQLRYTAFSRFMTRDRSLTMVR